MRIEASVAIDERKLGIEKRQKLLFHICRVCASLGPVQDAHQDKTKSSRILSEMTVGEKVQQGASKAWGSHQIRCKSDPGGKRRKGWEEVP